MSAQVVFTANGKVSGKIVDLKQKDAKLVHSYRNIPFAKPPVGSLRFMPPQPADPWDGIRDGSVIGNVPFYPSAFDEIMFKFFPLPESEYSKHVTDEDCLHVSVYTTHSEKGKNKPVMVWLYGGGFSSGTERLYDGSVLSGMNDVVVVVPNYRVGIFGFFSLGASSVCSGNQGILDQQLALKWVQDNIDAFGGDKNNITIFGESAGGVSVNHHIISPLSRGLFHKAISHSGQSTMPGLFYTPKIREENTKVVLDHLKIEVKNDVKILEALQNIPADELNSAVLELMMKKVSFMPTIDGKVFPKSPRKCIEDKDFATVPYIIGCNSSEAHGLLLELSGPNYAKGFDEEQAKKEIFFKMTDEGYNKCRNFYLNKDEQDDKRFSKMAGNIMGDAMFVAPAVNAATVHEEMGAPIYFYHGNFQLRMFHDEKYGKNIAKLVDWCVCDHGNEVLLTFGVPFSPFKMRYSAKFSDDEVKLSRKFMTYLTNFAKTGDPNKGDKVDIAWPKYGKDKSHLLLETPISTGKNLSPKETDFWINNVCQQMTDDNE